MRVDLDGYFLYVTPRRVGEDEAECAVCGPGSFRVEFRKDLKATSWLVGHQGIRQATHILYREPGRRQVSSGVFSDEDLNRGPLPFIIDTLKEIATWPAPTPHFPPAPGHVRADLDLRAYEQAYYARAATEEPPSPLVTCPPCKGTGGVMEGPHLGALCRACRGSGSIPRERLPQFDPEARAQLDRLLRQPV